jgi:metallophosphoesterase (TIGR00282 family)
VDPDSCKELFDAGADVLTSGNHIWRRKEINDYLEREPRLLRPLNMPSGAPGRGVFVTRTSDGVPVGVINAMGRVFMAPVDDPFAAIASALAQMDGQCRVIVVDFHGEASAEKVAMGWHLDGRVTAVIGTHTHVQTADERVLPGGTAYITDVGMTGPHDSVIGSEREAAISRFLTGVPVRLEPATGNVRLQAVVVTADAETGRAVAIERIDLSDEQPLRPAVRRRT